MIINQDDCIEIDRDRAPKLQSAIYYALDGDQVHILTMLAQKSGDPWVRLTRPAKFKIKILNFYRTECLEIAKLCYMLHAKEVPGDVRSSW